MTEPVKVAVTGAAGQISYSLLFRIAAGEVFGPNTSISLHLLEVESSMPILEAVEMELLDCSFPLLEGIKIGTCAEEIFEGCQYAFLIGAKARSKGMERSDLLKVNASIFVDQGKALNKVANRDVHVLVVGNPANTNALICMHNAPDLNPHNFFAMTRLDQNRAESLLAKRANVSVTDICGMSIWGNHSPTMVVDYLHATIKQRPVTEVINDLDWLQKEFTPRVQKRGAEVIGKRGSSSAASAAHGAITAMRDIVSPPECPHSAGIHTAGNSYGIDEDLFFSFPLVGRSVVQNLEFDAFLQGALERTQLELIEERDAIRKYL